MRVLQGDFVEGDVVRIDAPGGEIVFEKIKSLQAA
jgi:hypothetical protein